MGVQKPTRRSRRLSQIPTRVERVHRDVRDILNRRAEIARAVRMDRTPSASSAVGKQRLPEFGLNEGDESNAGYLGFESSGIGPAGVLDKPFGRARRPGMPAVRVAKEKMIHSERLPSKKRAK
jgi:hypothetical protein